jgi:AraC family transcriptional regulator of adaptative response/methylated-DNA-[protein]-cysteine methyltransferase
MFKRVVGLTPKEYAAEHRRQKVRETLGRSSSVTEAIFSSGYGSPARFYDSAKEVLGMTPQVYRLGGADETIHFAIAESSLGGVLVAATEVGVCAILLGDDPQELIDDLVRRFPAATLAGARSDFDDLVARVVSLVERPSLNVELPLDIRGTIFQQRVWKALRAIPLGATISYSELAERIGSPTAARAVAGACAANPLAVVVPCHRVVRRDGGLSGYRWGVEKKRELLKREQVKPEARESATPRHASK